jgi:hypothetical protein
MEALRYISRRILVRLRRILSPGSTSDFSMLFLGHNTAAKINRENWKWETRLYARPPEQGLFQRRGTQDRFSRGSAIKTRAAETSDRTGGGIEFGADSYFFKAIPAIFAILP